MYVMDCAGGFVAQNEVAECTLCTVLEDLWHKNLHSVKQAECRFNDCSSHVKSIYDYSYFCTHNLAAGRQTPCVNGVVQ